MLRFQILQGLMNFKGFKNSRTAYLKQFYMNDEYELKSIPEYHNYLCTD